MYTRKVFSLYIVTDLIFDGFVISFLQPRAQNDRIVRMA